MMTNNDPVFIVFPVFKRPGCLKDPYNYFGMIVHKSAPVY